MKIVLSEEEYIKRLSLILKRDFYPSLFQVQEFELEFTEPERLGIEEFQSLYITEDNASFAELLSRENEKKRNKFERVYGGPALLVDDPSKRLLLQKSFKDDSKFKRKNNNNSSILKWNEQELNIEDSKKPKINLKNTRFSNEEQVVKINIPNTPIFTFGTVVETPQRLINESNLNLNNSNRFRVPLTPVREQLAHSLTASTSTTNTSNISSLRALKQKKVKDSKSFKYELSDLKALTP